MRDSRLTEFPGDDESTGLMLLVCFDEGEGEEEKESGDKESGVKELLLLLLLLSLLLVFVERGEEGLDFDEAGTEAGSFFNFNFLRYSFLAFRASWRFFSCRLCWPSGASGEFSI